jgi:hypothetical protein
MSKSHNENKVVLTPKQQEQLNERLLSSAYDSNAIRLLIQQGAKFDACSKYDGDTALHYAASNRAIDGIRLLLEMGAKGDEKNYRGETPLSLAVRGYKIDNQNSMPYYIKDDVINLLLVAGNIFSGLVPDKEEDFDKEHRLKLSYPSVHVQAVNNNDEIQHKLAKLQTGLPDFTEDTSIARVVYETYISQFKTLIEKEIGIIPAVTPALCEAFEKAAIELVTSKEFKEKVELARAEMNLPPLPTPEKEEEKVVDKQVGEKSFVSRLFTKGRTFGGVPTLQELAAQRVVKMAADDKFELGL